MCEKQFQGRLSNVSTAKRFVQNSKSCLKRERKLKTTKKLHKQQTNPKTKNPKFCNLCSRANGTHSESAQLGCERVKSALEANRDISVTPSSPEILQGGWKRNLEPEFSHVHSWRVCSSPRAAPSVQVTFGRSKKHRNPNPGASARTDSSTCCRWGGEED